MGVRAEFSFLVHWAPPLSRHLPPRAVKEEGKKGSCLRVCICVHRPCLAILYITSHLPWAKTHSRGHTHCKECWEIWSCCSEKKKKYWHGLQWASVDFPRPHTVGPQLWESEINYWAQEEKGRKQMEMSAFALLLALAWPLPLPFHLLVSPFPITGLSFILTLISWLLKLALLFLLCLHYDSVAAVKFYYTCSG